MAAIADLYSSCLVSLSLDGYVHTTLLCQKVIAIVPDLMEVKGPSNHTNLIFDRDISLVRQEIFDSWDSEAMVLFKAAKILQKHMFKINYDFTVTFSHEGEVYSVPFLLLGDPYYYTILHAAIIPGVSNYM